MRTLPAEAPCQWTSVRRHVLQQALQRLTVLVLWWWLLAWLLSRASSNVLSNLPLAFVVVVGLHRFSQLLDAYVCLGAASASDTAAPEVSGCGGPGGLHATAASAGCCGGSYATPSAPHNSRHDNTSGQAVANTEAWKLAVGSPAVVEAWEHLCNSIVQEFVYDAWYAYISPDREWPAEVRRQLNTAFGEVARRARRVDWCGVLVRGVCNAVRATLADYREAVEKLGGATTALSLPHGERDAALTQQLAALGGLHPALQHPDGHYRVLRRMSECVLGRVLCPEDLRCTLARCVLRELFACCVLRSLMLYVTPYTANKLMMAATTGAAALGASGASDAAAAAAGTPGAADAACGFAVRARLNAEAEALQLQRQGSKWEAQVLQHTLSMPGSPAASAAVHQRVPTPPRAAAHSGSHPSSPGLPASPSERISPGQPGSPGLRQRFISKRSDSAPLPLFDKLPPKLFGPSTVRMPHSSSASDLIAAVRDMAAAAAGRGSPMRSWGATPAPASPAGPCEVASPCSLQQQQQQQEEPDWTQHGRGLGGCSLYHTYPPAAALPQSFPESGCDGPEAPEHAHEPGDALAAPLPSPGGAPPSGTSLAAEVVDYEALVQGGKEVAAYRVRVHDGVLEWTVMRRYRHFYALHRLLRERVVSYREAGLAPPPKRLMAQRDAAFIARRREQLDQYLGAMLLQPGLAERQELAAFLAPDWDGSDTCSVTSAAASSFSSVLGGRFDSTDEGSTDAEVALACLFDSRSRSEAHLVRLAPGAGVAAAEEKGEAEAGGRAGRVPGGRTLSLPLADSISSFSCSAQPPGASIGQQHATGAASSLANHDLHPGGAMPATGHAPASDHVGGASPAGPQPQQPAAHAGVWASAAGRRSPLALQRTAPAAACAGSPGAGYGPMSPRGASPRSPARSGAWLVRARAAGSMLQPLQAPWQRRAARGRAALASGRPLSAPLLLPLGQQQAVAASGFAGSCDHELEAPAAQAGEEAGAGPGAGPGGGGMWAEPGSRSPTAAAAGAAALPPSGPAAGGLDAPLLQGPLYDLVDAVFQLRSKGFFRRQVIGIVRQSLSLVAGGALDVLLKRSLASWIGEHSVAQRLRTMQAQLWPGGVFYVQAQAQQAQQQAQEQLGQARLEQQHMECPVAEQQDEAAPQPPGPPVTARSSDGRRTAPARSLSSSGGGRGCSSPSAGAASAPSRQPVLSAERYLEPRLAAPDADAVAAAVRCRLLEGPVPAPLLALLGGRGVYVKAMSEVYGMLQSHACISTIGYRVLEALLGALFPELHGRLVEAPVVAASVAAAPPGAASGVSH